MKIITSIITILFLPLIGFGGIIEVPGDYAGIQEAIDAAMDGDTVIVSPGTYMERIRFMGKAITVQSSGGAENTVINGSMGDCVVKFIDDEGLDSVLDGFTIMNGTNYGAGIYCHEASPTIIHNTITRNSAIYGGGGIGLVRSEALISRNTITRNKVTGKSTKGIGVDIRDSSPTITYNVISQNHSYYSWLGDSCKGNGIYCAFSNPTIANNLIMANNTDRAKICNGGGIYCYLSEPIIQDNVIKDHFLLGSNIASGGGIYCILSTAEISGNTISNNLIKIDSSNCYIYGGGVYFESSTVNLSHNILLANVSTSDGNYSLRVYGGGIYAKDCEGIIGDNLIEANCIRTFSSSGYYPNGGGIYCCSSGPMEIKRNTLKGNLSTWHGGGIGLEDGSYVVSENLISGNRSERDGAGLYLKGDADLWIDRNIFEGNESAWNGGGVFCQGPQVIFQNNLFHSNSAHFGGAFYFNESVLSETNTAVLVNNTIDNNSADFNGGGVYSWHYDCEIRNSIIWGNQAVGDYPHLRLFGRSKVTYCTVEDGYEGNLHTDPGFVDVDAGDYHLMAGSPCINRGSNLEAPVDDLDGALRPYMGTVDMGAYEFNQVHRLAADTFTLSQSTGGTVNLELDGGPANAGRRYLMLGSLSGTIPGLALPGGQAVLPIHWDHYTDLVLANLDVQWFFNFLAELNLQGQNQATVQFTGPMNPELLAKTLSFAYCLEGSPAWDFTSNPVAIRVIQ